MANEQTKSPVVPGGGEGNREADRRYREDVERFVRSGRVDPAAREAEESLEEEEEREREDRDRDPRD